MGGWSDKMYTMWLNKPAVQFQPDYIFYVTLSSQFHTQNEHNRKCLVAITIIEVSRIGLMLNITNAFSLEIPNKKLIDF